MARWRGQRFADVRLADWRKINGLTQEDVANALQPAVHWLTVSAWEQGRKLPSRGAMLAIYALTDGAVQPNDFYDLRGERRAA